MCRERAVRRSGRTPRDRHQGLRAFIQPAGMFWFPESYRLWTSITMSNATQHASGQCAFRRREFAELPTDNQRRWHAPQHDHGARQTALQYQRHQVKQKYTNNLASCVKTFQANGDEPDIHRPGLGKRSGGVGDKLSEALWLWTRSSVSVTT